MLVRIFILVLLGTFVVSDKLNVIERETIEGWRKDIQETLQEYYEQSRRAFEETVDELKRRTTGVIEISKRKFSDLKDRYDRIQANSKVFDEKNKVWETRLQELKDQTTEVLRSLSDRYEQLKKRTLNVIQKQQEMWESKIKELLEEEIEKMEEVESVRN